MEPDEPQRHVTDTGGHTSALSGAVMRIGASLNVDTV